MADEAAGTTNGVVGGVRWSNVVIGSSATTVQIGGDGGRIARRSGDETGLRAVLRCTAVISQPGIYRLDIEVSSVPMAHELDPLEFGVVASSGRGFRGVGYVSCGETEDAQVCKEGEQVTAAPSITPLDIVSIEVDICALTNSKSIRFLHNGKFVTRPIPVSEFALPLVPVVTIPNMVEICIKAFSSSTPIFPPIKLPTVSLWNNMDTIDRQLAAHGDHQDPGFVRHNYLVSMALDQYRCVWERGPRAHHGDSLSSMARQIVYDVVDAVAYSVSAFGYGPCVKCISELRSVLQCRVFSAHQCSPSLQRVIRVHERIGDSVELPNGLGTGSLVQVHPLRGFSGIQLDTGGQVLVARRDKLFLSMDLVSGNWIYRRIAFCTSCRKLRHLPLKSLVSQHLNWSCDCCHRGVPLPPDEDDRYALGRITTWAKTNPVELTAAYTMSPERIWELQNGRLIIWLDGMPYAIAHQGESLMNVAFEFQLNMNEILLMNCAIDSRLGPSSTLTRGSTVLLPWLEDSEKSARSVLVECLANSGWKFGMQVIGQHPHQQHMPTFEPPESLRHRFPGSPQLRHLTVVLQHIPEYLRAFRFAQPEAAARYILDYTPIPAVHAVRALQSQQRALLRAQTARGAAALQLHHPRSSQPQFASAAAPAANSRSRPVARQHHRPESPPPATPAPSLTATTPARKKPRRRSASGGGRCRPSGANAASAAVASADATLSPASAIEDVDEGIFLEDWILAKWAGDGQWYFAKIQARNPNGTVNVAYEDGDMEDNKPIAELRAPTAKQRLQPRQLAHGKVFFSKKAKQWIALYLGRKRIPGTFCSVDEAIEATENYHRLCEQPKTHDRRQRSTGLDSTGLHRTSHDSRRAPQSLPTAGFDSRQPSRGDSRGAVRADQGPPLCPICLEDFLQGSEHAIVTQCCGNRFHRECLDRQLQVLGVQSVCPTCRNSIAFNRQLRAIRRLERFAAHPGPESATPRPKKRPRLTDGGSREKPTTALQPAPEAKRGEEKEETEAIGSAVDHEQSGEVGESSRELQATEGQGEEESGIQPGPNQNRSPLYDAPRHLATSTTGEMEDDRKGA